MFVQRILFLTILLMFSTSCFAMMDPIYSGLVDMRFKWGTQSHRKTGSFEIENLQIKAVFPLSETSRFVYESRLTGNIEQFDQLYVEVKHMFGDLTDIRWGRFYVPFIAEDLAANKTPFISWSILRDARWGNLPLLPFYENGITAFKHNFSLSYDFYLVNGGGWLSHEGNTNAGKSIGGRFTYRYHSVFQLGISACFHDLVNTTLGSTDRVLIGGGDLSFSLWEVKFRGAGLLAIGNQSGSSKTGIGLISEAVLPLENNVQLGVHGSLFMGAGTVYRGMGSLKIPLNKRLSIKLEAAYEKFDIGAQIKLQAQTLIEL